MRLCVSSPLWNIYARGRKDTHMHLQTYAEGSKQDAGYTVSGSPIDTVVDGRTTDRYTSEANKHVALIPSVRGDKREVLVPVRFSVPKNRSYKSESWSRTWSGRLLLQWTLHAYFSHWLSTIVRVWWSRREGRQLILLELHTRTNHGLTSKKMNRGNSIAQMEMVDESDGHGIKTNDQTKKESRCRERETNAR